jgi:hypothetical protein
MPPHQQMFLFELEKRQLDKNKKVFLLQVSSSIRIGKKIVSTELLQGSG